MKKRKRLAPGQELSVDVTMKSLRNPPLDITCSGQPVSTSILSLKNAVSEKFGIPTDKIRLLLKKKPCADSKTIRDLVPEGEGEVEFTIMVIGGQAAAAIGQEGGLASRDPGPPSTLGASGGTLLDLEFWSDLKGFLGQRLKDEKGAEMVYDTFKNAWDKKPAMQK
ncbi:hypothetical protein GP486_004403 [Trichoglossum hirsutum]|uniref:Ubiquitin-like domain-containing protein n=1 Tax=Trichoglossum hirsutum TaxID=265104 RepID=A0A9P8RPS4_9PEZI|nr:hypothetical protein GP486_004403 [Trichoglossum hirsutum]